MASQQKYLQERQYGGTIRLGAWPCSIKKDTLLYKSYKKFGNGLSDPWYSVNSLTNGKYKPRKASLIFERHRHRFEFNNKYRKKFEDNGFIISGSSPDGKLVEAIELTNHPFFMGTQFHPEYLSRPLTPHPIFLSFIEAIVTS